MTLMTDDVQTVEQRHEKYVNPYVGNSMCPTFLKENQYGSISISYFEGGISEEVFQSIISKLIFRCIERF